MLGIDLTDNTIRVVKLKHKRGKLIVCGGFTLTNDHNADITNCGDELLKKLISHGWHKSDAVIAINQRPSLVKRYYLPAQSTTNDNLSQKQIIESVVKLMSESLLGTADEVVIDTWLPASELKECNYILAAPANKNEIAQVKKLAEYSNLRLKTIDLRAVASVNSLYQSCNIADRKNSAAVFRDENRIYLALTDNFGLAHIQAVAASTTGDGREDASSIIRIFNTMKLSQSDLIIPTRIFISDHENHCDQQKWAQTVAAALTADTALEITICPPDLGLSWQKKPQEPQATYSAAIGAALNGLHLARECFDYLHIKEVRANENQNTSRAILRLLIILIASVAIALWFGIIGQRKSTIKNLERSIAQYQIQKVPVFKAQEQWMNCAGYISQTQGGTRLEYLRILYEITRLMPPTEKAYITNLSVFSDRATYGYNVKLSIKANEAGLTSYITGNLKKSPLFRDIQDGGRTNDKTDEFYPTNISITFNIVRPLNPQVVNKEGSKL